MRLAFMGSPGFAVPALEAICVAGHEILAVYCQSPKPVGRGQRMTRCAVHEAAARLGLVVRTPVRLRGNAEEIDFFAALDLDAAVVAAYGLILPPELLDAPRRGCLNIHASLLPRWRGAAPIHAAILAGDTETGVTIMQMDRGLDTGPMLLARIEPISAVDTTAQVHERLADLGAQMITQVLDGHYDAQPQPDDATYAPKLSKSDAMIDWRRPAEEIERQIRAFVPWPGTETRLDGVPLKILAAAFVAGDGMPGTVIDDRLTVACGQGAVRPSRVQRPGRAAMETEAFLRGHPVAPGTVLR